MAFLKVKAWLHKVLGWVCVMDFMLLTLVVLWQVVSRYALASPSSVSEEVARILLMWLGLLGACYVHLDNKHIAIRMFPEVAPVARDRLVMIVCQAFSVVLLVGGWKLCAATFALQQTTPVLGWPQGVVYSVVPLSGLILCLANYLHLKEQA